MTSLRPLELTDGAAVLANAKAVRARLRNMAPFIDTDISIRGGHPVSAALRDFDPAEYIEAVTPPEPQKKMRPSEAIYQAKALIAGELGIDPNQISIFLPAHFGKAASDGQYTMAAIRDVTAHSFGISVNDLMSHRRTANIVAPRQIAMALSKRLTYRSLPEIGNFFGGRDHTTVLHAIRKYDSVLDAAGSAMQENSSLSDWLKAITEAL